MAGATKTTTPRKRPPASERRRKPGECWNLWRVVGRDRTTHEQRAIGLLVTDRERFPNLIGYVRGTGDRSLRRALAIRRRPGRAATAVDLRGSKSKRFPEFLKGMLLMPIDRLGRVIATDDTFAGGMFQHATMRHMKTGKVERVFEFGLFTHDYMRFMNEQSGSPAKPPTPTPASNEGEKAEALTAA